MPNETTRRRRHPGAALRWRRQGRQPEEGFSVEKEERHEGEGEPDEGGGEGGDEVEREEEGFEELMGLSSGRVKLPRMPF